MRDRLLSLLLILAVLFGGVIAPALAHAQGDADVHVSDIIDVHVGNPATGDDSKKPVSGMPGEPAAHHHCTIGLTATGPDICLVDVTGKAIVRPAATRLLVSHAQAPPTQPPSA